ncbi:MAG: TonB-dependent receptor [Candidatus Aureabacteria bacterium]|nr:TonB-dependent receptor [Candidatus Auribacterota bacterium]
MKKNKKFIYSLILFTVSIFISFPHIIFADDELGEGIAFEMFLLDQKVYIASKTEESTLTTPGTVYVITEEDIKRYGWRDMKEILRAIPNMDLMWQYNWLNGGQRGFTGNFAGTLLLIDGREVQNLLASEAFMTNDFPSHRIKRIEILQGPNSTLYGGNATQGVINIVTKFGDKGDKDTTEAELILGEVNTEQFAGVFKKNTDDWDLGFSASIFKSNQNWSELKDFVMDENLYSRTSLENETDSNGNLTGRTHRVDDFRAKETSQFRNYEESRTADMYVRYMGFYGGVNYFKEENTSGIEYVEYEYGLREARRGYRQMFLGYNHEFSDNFKGFIEYLNVLEDELWLTYQPVDKYSWVTTSDRNLQTVSESIEETKKDRIRMQIDYQLDDHYIIAGYEGWNLQIDHLLSEANVQMPKRIASNIVDNWPVDKEETKKQSIFVQDSYSIIPEKLKLTAGIMYNKQDHTNDSWIPRASLVYQPTRTSAIKLIYGKAFRPPNIFEYIGVPDELESQEMEMFELNYTCSLINGDVKLYNIASLYTMEASNLYSKVWVGSGGAHLTGWKTVVGGSEKVNGFEDMLRFDYKDLSGFLGFRWVQPDEHTVDGKSIVKDVPETKIKLGLSYDILDYLTASIFVDHFADVKTEANKYRMDGTEVYTIDGWTTVDLNINVGEFDLNDMSAMVSLYVQNIFDKTYYHANVRGTSPVQFLQPPRTVRLKATCKF